MPVERFVEAQDIYGWDRIIAELRSGKKTGHWIWFVFPQASGLGHSPMSEIFSLHSFDEVEEYLDHPILSIRLHDAAHALLTFTRMQNTPLDALLAALGPIDVKKLHASMTLLRLARPAMTYPNVILWRGFLGSGHQDTYRILKEWTEQ